MTTDPRTIAADIMCGNARCITPAEVWAHIGQAYDTAEIDASIADEVAELIAKTGIDLIWPDGTKNTELDAARVEIERLHAELAEVRAKRDVYEVESLHAQLTAANRHADGLANDLRSANTANTAYANENARLRSQLAEREAGIQRLIAFRNAKVYEVDELATRLRTVRALAEGPHGEGDFGSIPARDLLNAIGEEHPAESRPVVVLDSTDKAEVAR